MNKITQLTPEQKFLIPDFINKWNKIAFSTEPTNKQEITEAIEQIYIKINRTKPIIYFCDRPTYTKEILLDCSLDTFGLNLTSTACNMLFDEIEDYIKLHVTDSLWESLNDELRIRNFDCKPLDSWNYLGDYLEGFYGDDISFYEGKVFSKLIHNGIIFDYCRTLIGSFNKRLEKNWTIFQILVNNSSQIFFYENICIVYEKLKILSVDDSGLLHNDGKPAIKFSNEASFYACHGNIIPEQYGKIPLNQWKSQWLTEVDNFLRDILILGIGEEKICHELKTKEKINQVGVLTPNQKTLIPRYRYKWSKIALSTEKCDRNLVINYINRAYKYLGRKETEAIFFDSPFLAQKYIIDNKLKTHLRKSLADNICKYACTLNSYIDKRIINEVESELQCIDDLCTSTYHGDYTTDVFFLQHEKDIICDLNQIDIINPIFSKIKNIFGQIIRCIKLDSYSIINAATQDYLLFNFDCGEETERIKIFVGIMENCGWIYPYEEVCLVCERPINLYLDENYLLHAEGKPAIEYADGFCIYAHHGDVYLENNSQ